MRKRKWLKHLLRCSSCDRPFIGANIKTVAKPICKECWIKSLESRLTNYDDEFVLQKATIESLESRLKEAQNTIKRIENQDMDLKTKLKEAEKESYECTCEHDNPHFNREVTTPSN